MIKKTQEILDMFNYYRIFIEYFTWIIISFYDDFKKQFDEFSYHNLKARIRIHDKQQFSNTPKIREIFRLLQWILASSFILIHPDFEREFILYINIYTHDIIKSLYQISLKNQKKYLILYISHRFNKYESKYIIIEMKYLEFI